MPELVCVYTPKSKRLLHILHTTMYIDVTQIVKPAESYLDFYSILYAHIYIYT